MSHDHDITNPSHPSSANGNYTVHHPRHNQQLRSISLFWPEPWLTQQKMPNAIKMAPVVGNPGTTSNHRPPLSTRCSLPTTRQIMIQDYERYYGVLWSLCGRLRRKRQILLSIGHFFFFFFWLQEASPLLLSWILTISLLFTVFTLSGTSVCWVVDVIPIGLSGLF